MTVPDLSEYYITFDGGAYWLEHFPPGSSDDEGCDDNPVAQIDAGTGLQELIRAVERHHQQSP